MLNFKQKLNKITTLIFDIDGVLTDGKVLVMESGEMVRNVNSKDAYALQLAVRLGYNITIISGGNNVAVKNVLAKVGIKNIYISQHNKKACYDELLETFRLKHEEILYMGDDLPDYEVMSHVGVATCPRDAAPEIKSICCYISPRNGGEGCVRDIIEQVMRVQGKWEISNW